MKQEIINVKDIPGTTPLYILNHFDNTNLFLSGGMRNLIVNHTKVLRKYGISRHNDGYLITFVDIF